MGSRGLGVVATFLLACGGNPPPADSPAPGVTQSSSPVAAEPAPSPATTEQAPRPEPAPPANEPPAPTGPSAVTAKATALPALDFADVGKARMKKAIAFNKAGLAKHRAKDYAGAAAAYQDAIRADPGHLLARYNLACVYNLAGRSSDGLAILETIKNKGCPSCLGQLVHARKDKDWQSQWKTPRFEALTSKIKIPKLDRKQATKAVIDAIETGKTASIAHLWPPRSPVVHSYSGMLCEGRGCDPRYVHRGPKGMATLFKVLHAKVKLYPDIDGMQMMFDRIDCDKDCCTLENDESVASHSYSNLGGVCFKRHPGGVELLSGIREWGD